MYPYANTTWFPIQMYPGHILWCHIVLLQGNATSSLSRSTFQFYSLSIFNLLIVQSIWLCPDISPVSSFTSVKILLSCGTFTETGRESDWSHAQLVSSRTQCHCGNLWLREISCQKSWVPSNFKCSQVLCHITPI